MSFRARVIIPVIVFYKKLAFPPEWEVNSHRGGIRIKKGNYMCIVENKEEEIYIDIIIGNS